MFFRFLRLYALVEFVGCVEANSTSLEADGWVPDFGLCALFGVDDRDWLGWKVDSDPIDEIYTELSLLSLYATNMNFIFI